MERFMKRVCFYKQFGTNPTKNQAQNKTDRQILHSEMEAIGGIYYKLISGGPTIFFKETNSP